MRAALILCLCCLSGPALSEDARERLLGTWGSAVQCDRQLLVDGGSVHAEPFVISHDWLRHGDLWCRLSWFPPLQRPGGLFAGSIAQCGEDAARSYRLNFSLTGDALTLIWDDALSNGPLARCSGGAGG